jgi:hypothetical protein
LVDTLLRYVEEQMAQGFKPDIIRARLVRQGYSPALVDGVIESVSIKKNAGAPVPLGSNHEKSIFSKLIILLLIMGVIVAGAFLLVPKLTGEKVPLLDVQATPDKLTYNPGDQIDFDLEIINMGSAERFDITLLYRVLDKNDNSVISKEETTAISTSTSLRKFVTLPSGIKPGSYSLKVFANYGGKVATTAFSFEVAEITVTQPTQPSCTDGLRNQNELGIDCGGVCGGYWYDGACHPRPKTSTVTNTTKASCIDGIRNQDEIGIDCGGMCGNYWYDNSCHALPKQTNVNAPNLNPTFTSTMMEVRTTVKTDPEGAKNTCLGLGKESERDECLKLVGQISLDKDYCAMIVSSEIRDQCYYPIFMKGDYTVCELLYDAESKKSCNQLRDIKQIMNKINESKNEEAANMTLNSESLNYFSG